MANTLEITPQEIQLKATATNWEEAIKVAANPLVNSNRITEDYVTSMIDSVKKTWPLYRDCSWLGTGSCKTISGREGNFIFHSNASPTS